MTVSVAYNARAMSPTFLMLALSFLQIGASRTALVTVADARGRAIVDLSPDDFVVRENGQPREVLSLRVADYPIVVVLDNGTGARRDFETLRRAAAHFIGRVGQRVVAVAQADPPAMLTTFDDERKTVMERLDRLAVGSSARGRLLEGVVGAARAIRESGSPFSAIVIVTTGPADNDVPTELVTPILESGAIVHVVSNRERSDDRNDRTARSVETMRALTDETHGQFTTIYSAASYQAALDRLADRLATEFMLEYVVPVGSPGANDVRLGVRIPGARVNGLGSR